MTDPAFQILLVEDNHADIYLLRKALEHAELHFELTAIDDGVEALAYIQRQGKYANSVVPDLAVLDLNLPKRGGIEALKAMRESKDLADVPAVMASSSASPRDLAEAQKYGVDRCITKPADLDGFLKLGQMLKAMLNERRAQRQGVAGADANTAAED